MLSDLHTIFGQLGSAIHNLATENHSRGLVIKRVRSSTQQVSCESSTALDKLEDNPNVKALLSSSFSGVFAKAREVRRCMFAHPIIHVISAMYLNLKCRDVVCCDRLL